MFAIGFDLLVRETKLNHPKGISQVYAEIGSLLNRYGFTRVQGSVYTSVNEDLATLTSVMIALKALPWFPASVRDIRAFRVEQWSDFTNFVKS